jgi:hypothetical protein
MISLCLRYEACLVIASSFRIGTSQQQLLLSAPGARTELQYPYLAVHRRARLLPSRWSDVQSGTNISLFAVAARDAVSAIVIHVWRSAYDAAFRIRVRHRIGFDQLLSARRANNRSSNRVSSSTNHPSSQSYPPPTPAPPRYPPT